MYEAAGATQLPAVGEKSTSHVDSSVAPDPDAVPVTVIVVGAPVQSESVGAGAPTGTLNIFSMSICAITVELLCWRFLGLVPIARGIDRALASTSTCSATPATPISLTPTPPSPAFA